MHTGLLLEMAAETVPDRVAVGSLAGGLSYGELAARARAGGAWIAGHGEGPVVFIGLNSAAVPTALFASAEIGRPFAPLNYRLADAELRGLLARTAPSVAIVDDDMMPRVAGTAGVALVSRSGFEAACLDPRHRQSDRPEADVDVAVLLFTSGTTGAPKAAVLRHRHLAAYVISTVEFMHAEADEAALVSVPPYHIAGVSAALTSLYAGRRTVYLPAFTPEAWVETAVEEQITHAMLVPTMLGRVLSVLEARGERLPRLRALAYGGGRMPASVIEKAMALLPEVDFVNGYGLTETSSTVAVLSAEDHRQAIASAEPAIRRRLGSVGRPLPALELEIRGPDGQALPPGRSGEVFVRGDQIAGEYLHKKVIADDGWFATNDAGWLDEAGYLFVEGRLDDVIVRGGENISPGEIEDVLRTHPGVADVAVLGLPDDRWGEKIAAVIAPKGPPPSTEELAAWVRARLRSTKTPETWAWRAELPYNDTGKLLRRLLRQELQHVPAQAR
jgi:acyl-CoA synthetase (AMP-forming)/AMP-acid ligase II